jgi:putative hydrolases of HD superfamily
VADNLKPDVNFLFEMGSIRFIERMWKRFLNADFANLAEHHFRVFWIAMVIAKHEGGDTGKIAKLAMVHDIAESRTGDVDYLARQYVERNEELGITDMLTGTSLQEEFLALWQEYETRESLESKIVKDADNLEVDFELAEQASHGFPLEEQWKGNRTHVAEHKMYTDTGRALARSLKGANPHEWHQITRNRGNDGDWKR